MSNCCTRTYIFHNDLSFIKVVYIYEVNKREHKRYTEKKRNIYFKKDNYNADISRNIDFKSDFLVEIFIWLLKSTSNIFKS